MWQGEAAHHRGAALQEIEPVQRTGAHGDDHLAGTGSGVRHDLDGDDLVAAEAALDLGAHQLVGQITLPSLPYIERARSASHAS